MSYKPRVYATHKALPLTEEVPGSPFEYVFRSEHDSKLSVSYRIITELTQDRDRWRAIAQANQESRRERLASSAMNGLLVTRNVDDGELINQAAELANAMMKRLDAEARYDQESTHD